MTVRHFIGLATGRSLRGIDAALVRVDGTGLGMRQRLIAHDFQEHPPDLSNLLARCSEESVFAREINLVHRALGEGLARACLKLAERTRFPLSEAACVGMTGQETRLDLEGRLPSVLSLGMAEAVAERTGLTVVGHWAARDVVMGGQGVLLAAPVDALHLADPRENRCVLQLGGIATATWLPAGGNRRDLLGFAGAPCGCLLDNLMTLLTSGKSSCDPWGKHGVQGRCIDDLLAEWLNHPILQRRPSPHQILQDFRREFVVQAIMRVRNLGRTMLDLVCTATHFVAQALSRSLETNLPGKPDRIILCGGGVRNGFLIRLLEELLAPIPLERPDAFGFPAEAHKAWSAAGLAAMTLDGIPANLPSVTGASGSRLLGSFVPGSSAHWARTLAWMAAQSAPLSRRAA